MLTSDYRVVTLTLECECQLLGLASRQVVSGTGVLLSLSLLTRAARRSTNTPLPATFLAKPPLSTLHTLKQQQPPPPCKSHCVWEMHTRTQQQPCMAAVFCRLSTDGQFRCDMSGVAATLSSCHSLTGWSESCAARRHSAAPRGTSAAGQDDTRRGTLSGRGPRAAGTVQCAAGHRQPRAALTVPSPCGVPWWPRRGRCGLMHHTGTPQPHATASPPGSSAAESCFLCESSPPLSSC